MISLLGMLVMGVGFIQGLAVGAVSVVAVTVAASFTLLPALLGFAGERIELTRWRHTGDSRTSVADGLAATAKVITAASANMVFVFGSCILEPDRVVKLMGVGLATAILLDATIVRMLLVPATMELLGDKNWALPRWLDRVLPDVEVEGHAGASTKERELQPAGKARATHRAPSDPRPGRGAWPHSRQLP